MDEPRSRTASIRWRPTNTEEVTTTVTPVSRGTRPPVQASRTLCGMFAREAFSHLPRLPDQGSTMNLWILVSIWMSISADRYGTPYQIVSRVLPWIRDILDYQIRYPFEWKGLGKFSTPESETLVTEFGPVEFIRACLAVLSFYVVLYHHDKGMLALSPMIIECDQLLGRWAKKMSRQGTTS